MVSLTCCSSGELYSPYGVALDLEGNIIICDDGNHRIAFFSPTGTWLQSFGVNGDDPGSFQNPVAIHVQLNGDLLICERRNHRIQIFDKELNLIKVIGDGEKGKSASKEAIFSFPHGIIGDINGSFLVVDSTPEVRIFSRDGEFLSSFIGPTGGVTGWGARMPAIDPDGNLIIVDYGGHKIHVFE